MDRPRLPLIRTGSRTATSPLSRLRSDGSLYVGFFDHGLDILSPDASRIRHQEDDHLFCINRLALDPVRHTMAAATANGLGPV